MTDEQPDGGRSNRLSEPEFLEPEDKNRNPFLCLGCASKDWTIINDKLPISPFLPVRPNTEQKTLQRIDCSVLLCQSCGFMRIYETEIFCKFLKKRRGEDLLARVRETIERPASLMILMVLRPDRIGNDNWEFRHGREVIKAEITDVHWLRYFHSSRIDVRPGDALRCYVSQKISYGFDSDVIANKYTIEKVVEVIADPVTDR